MKIGMMLPAHYAVGSPFNGVREQALFQAEALEDIGHEVVRLHAWEKYDLDTFDIVHFFQGGPLLHDIEKTTVNRSYKLVFAPIIDSDIANWRYRFASLVGRIHPKIRSIQAYYAIQGNGSDVVIVRSENEKSKLVDGLGVSRDKVKIALNGCPCPRDIRPNIAREKFELTEDFVLHISRYSQKNKNVANMIRAIGPSGRQLVIAGTCESTPVLDEINRVAKDFENVKFIGRVNDDERDSLYAACRVFCLPSFREGTGLVAVEAASYGASIVITANGGPPDYFLSLAEYVQFGGPDEIGDAVDRAWAKNSEQVNLKNHVRENLTWRTSAERLMQIYKDIL